MNSVQYLFKVGNSMGLFSDDMDYTSDYRCYKGYSESFNLSEIENGGWDYYGYGYGDYDDEADELLCA